MKNKIYSSFILAYIFSVILSTILFTMINGFSLSIMMGLVIYIFPLLYWQFYDRSKLQVYFPKIILGLRYPVLLIAILGICQFYFSPDIWGLINMNGPVDPYVVKASSDTFSNWIFYLRATSILASPQVFGLFMVLYSLILYSYVKKNTLNNILILIYLFSGAHSGNKSFFLILILYMMYYFIKSGSMHTKIYICIITIFFLALIIYFSEYVTFLDRIVSVENIVDEEQDGRLSVYRELLEDVTFVGTGAGSHMALDGMLSDRPAESYFLQILLELGIMPFFLFLSIFFLNLILNKRKGLNILLVLIALSMIFVHCFNAFIFFLMWACFYITPLDIENSN